MALWGMASSVKPCGQFFLDRGDQFGVNLFAGGCLVVSPARGE